MSPVTPASQAYRPDIDGLRTIAVLGVIFFHVFPQSLPGGFVGVDIFFVISGFLISGLIFRDQRLGQFDVANFYARRIWRIFPALILVLLASLTFGWCVLFPDEYRQLGKQTVGGAAFVSNLVLWRETTYFDSAAQSKPLLHLWSLGIEEQFYIFWPLFLTVLSKRVKKVMPAVWTIAIISFALNVLDVGRHPNATFYIPATRVWELMIGATLAGVALRGQDSRTRTQFADETLAVSGCTLIVIALLFLNDKTPYPGYGALLPTLGTAFLIHAGPSAWVNRKILSSRPAVFIGLISYPLYLWHWPALVYLKLIMNSDFSPVRTDLGIAKGVTMGAVFGLAWATWKFIETPIRGAKGASRAVTTMTLIAAMVAVMLLGAFSFASLVPARLDKLAITRILKAADDWYYPGTNFQSASFTTQEIHSRSNFKTLFAGDSHIEQYWPRAKALIKADPYSAAAIFATSGGCPPLPGLNRAGYFCPAFYEFWVNRALVANVNVVVIGGFWEMYVLGPTYSVRLPSAAPPAEFVNAAGARLTPDDIEDAWKGLERTVTSLVKAGKHVVLLSSNPTSAGFDPHSMLRRLRSPSVMSPQLINKVEFSRLIAPIDVRLSLIAANTGAVLIHPADYLCNETECPATDDYGSPLYRDWNHLTASAAASRATFIDSTLRVF